MELNEVDCMIKCKECDREFKNNRGLMSRVKIIHDIIKYYEDYRRDELGGYCIKCGEVSPIKVGDTKRGHRYIDGFHRYCRNCSSYMSCMECCLEFPDKTSLMAHVGRQHDTLEYHDKYLRTKDNGYCKECGKPTPVQINMRVRRSFEGFKAYCSDECHSIGRSKWTRKRLEKLWQDPDYQVKMSQLATERVLDPTNNFGGELEGWDELARKRSKFNNKPVKAFGCRFRSRFEFYMAKRLEKANIKWQHEPKVALPDGKYCLPDFYLPEYNLFIELRPEKMVDEKLLKKIKQIKHTYEKEVVLVTNIQGGATLISRLDESRKMSPVNEVWVFKDKQGELKENTYAIFND